MLESIASRLKNRTVVLDLLDKLEREPSQTYDLLFYASFADKLLPVMQKAGPSAHGFSRMQQSFTEAVEKVRAAIALAGSNGFHDATRYTDLTPQAMPILLDLIHDLAIVKQGSRD